MRFFPRDCKSKVKSGKGNIRYSYTTFAQPTWPLHCCQWQVRIEIYKRDEGETQEGESLRISGHIHLRSRANFISGLSSTSVAFRFPTITSNLANIIHRQMASKHKRQERRHSMDKICKFRPSITIVPCATTRPEIALLSYAPSLSILDDPPPSLA